MTIRSTMLSSFLITLGLLLGALAVTGYFEPRQEPVHASFASHVAPTAGRWPAKPDHARARFVAEEPAPQPKPARAASNSPAQAPSAAPPPARKRVVQKDPPKPKKPQQAASAWPWNWFGN